MTDAALLACSASAWEGDPARCRWCNAEFAPPRRRWCSDACSWAFTRNHMWTAASRAARKRDRDRCVRCGVEDALVERGTGWERTMVSTLQVHHRTPVLGKHGTFGCLHHLDGLETLCKPCHLAEHAPAPAPVSDQLTLALVADVPPPDGIA